MEGVEPEVELVLMGGVGLCLWEEPASCSYTSLTDTNKESSSGSSSCYSLHMLAARKLDEAASCDALNWFMS